MPFSDPLAAGPPLQRASFVALKHDIVMDDVFSFVTEARSRGLTVPVVLMGYVNPFLAYGETEVVAAAAAAHHGRWWNWKESGRQLRSIWAASGKLLAGVWGAPWRQLGHLA